MKKVISISANAEELTRVSRCEPPLVMPVEIKDMKLYNKIADMEREWRLNQPTQRKSLQNLRVEISVDYRGMIRQEFCEGLILGSVTTAQPDKIAGMKIVWLYEERETIRIQPIG